MMNICNLVSFGSQCSEESERVMLCHAVLDQFETLDYRFYCMCHILTCSGVSVFCYCKIHFPVTCFVSNSLLTCFMQSV